MSRSGVRVRLPAPPTDELHMGEFPSGQRGQTVNLLAMPSMVRIHLPPPKIPIVFLDGRYFSLRGRWSRSLSPSGEIPAGAPKISLAFLAGEYFFWSLPGSRSSSPIGEIPAGAPKICKHHSMLADFYFFVLHSSLFTSL